MVDQLDHLAAGTGRPTINITEKGGGGGRSGSSVKLPPKPKADDIVNNTPKPKGFLKNLTKSQKYGLGAAAAVVAGLAYQKQRQSVDERFR